MIEKQIGHLDDLDKQIILLLQEDGRMSFKEIGDKLGKTEATIRRRVNRLIEENQIKKFTVVVPNNNMKVVIKIAPDLKQIKDITTQLLAIEEITDIWRLSGECGLLIRLEISEIEKLDPLVEEKLSTIEGLNIREVCIVTKEIKSKAE